MNKRPVIILAVALMLFGGFAVHGATRVSTSSGGNWNSTSTWIGGVVPTTSDTAIIRAGASVTVTSGAAVNSLIFSNNSSSTATLTVNSGVTFTVTAGITNQNSATTNTAVLIQGAGALTCAALTVGGTTTPTPANSARTATLTCTISNLSVSGNVTVRALYNSSQAAANQGVFALGSGGVGVGGSIVFVTVPLFGPTLTLAAGSQSGTLTLGGMTPFTITGGGSSTFTANGTNATVNYSGAAQTVKAATYQHLILSGSGAKTTAGVVVNGTLSMRGTATASAAPAYGSNATLEYNGNAAQTSGPELTAGIPRLTINNSYGVTLASSSTVSNTLTLASGKLTTGANQLNLAANASISGGGAASYVSGNLQKAFSAGTQSFTFPIGDSSTYAPLALSNLSVTSPGSLKASTAAGSHPQSGTSGLDPNRNVNRYWALTQSGGTFGAYGATFNYPAADVDTNAAPAQFEALRWNGGAWSATSETGTPTTTSTSIGTQSGLGDFAIGNPASWHNGAWKYRVAIGIDHSRVAGSLTNFPVLISLTNVALQQYAQASGNDLLFTSSDGTTKLAHEIERYTASTGALVAWVNVPSLSAAADTVLYLYYGNASATNQQNAAAVWDSGYKGVWHLNQAPTGSTGDMADSTSFNNAGTSRTIAAGAQVAGQITGSLALDGSSDYISTATSFNNPSTVTVQAWVKTTSTAGTKVVGFESTQTGTGSSTYDRHIYIGTDGMARFGTYNNATGSANIATSTNAVNDGQWHFLVGCRDNLASNVCLYVDGVLQATTGSSAGQSYTGWYRIGSYTLFSGNWPASVSGYFAGSVDEVRVSHAVRSPAWVTTEFNNQRAPGTFHRVGIPELAFPTKLAIASVNDGSSPVFATAFDVVVQAHDDSGVPQNVRSNTAVSLSLNTGTGALGGTLAGTIPAGTNSVTISGVTYTKAESGVSITATRTSGDNLAAANSSPFTIDPADQSIDFPSPGNQTYGVGPIALNATASSGLMVSYSVTSGSATVSNNVLAIIGAGSVTIQASQSGNADWNAATPVIQTISIAQRTVTGAVTVDNKTYDATTGATIATRVLSGVTNSDTVSLTGGTATFADKNVGDGKTVTATGLALTGADAGNYVLASTSATNTANITQAALTVSATGVSKVYDGTTGATVTLSDDRLPGDVLTANHTTATFADKDVGNDKTVTVSGISISGADSGNYTVNSTASTTANITQAVLTVSATGVSKVYDGTTGATVLLSDNRFAGDTLTTSYTSANFADPNVGDGKTVSVSGISVTGADSANYGFNSTAVATANLLPATLTVTANDTNRPYGTPNPDFTASYSGFVNGEGTNVLDGSPGLSSAATTNSPVGDYAIEVSPGTLGATNYVFNLASGTLAVTEVPPVLVIGLAPDTEGLTNQVTLSCVGVAPDSLWHVLASTDLLQWTDIGTVQAAPDGAITFTDADAPLQPVRFYRLFRD